MRGVQPPVPGLKCGLSSINSIYKLDCQKLCPDAPVAQDGAILYGFPGKPWRFVYHGTEDNHFGALWPVDTATPPNGMEYANKGYFDAWHKLKDLGWGVSGYVDKCKWIDWKM